MSGGTATDGVAFGPYRLRSLIGRGGMGEVWRALDTVREREVAIKRIGAGPSRDPGLRARFRREARLAARLTSAHVIPIHDFGEIDGQLFLDMRLVRGPDLRGVLDAHPDGLAPDAVRDVVTQLCDALDAAHDQGLVHRDVKPSNVLVDPARGNLFCYLADFGVAVPVDTPGDTRITLTGTTVGTPAYMAPELLGGQRAGPAGDVYAVGCVLYELLTGRTPYPGPGQVAQHYQHVHAPVPRPSAVRPWLAGFDPIVDAALAKDPARRPPRPGDLARALPPSGPVVARPAPVPPGPAFAPAPSGAPTYVPPGHPPLGHPPPGQPPPGQPPLPPGFGPQGPAPRPRYGRRVALVGLAAVVVAGLGAGGYVLAQRTGRVVGPPPPTIVTARKLPLTFSSAQGVGLTPDGRIAYVIVEDRNQFALLGVDTTTEQVTSRIPVDAGSNKILVGPDGKRAYVVVPGSTQVPRNLILVVDLQAGSVTAQLPVEGTPTYPALSPDGSRLYVTVSNRASSGPGRLVVVDTARAAIVASTAIGTVPTGVTVSADGRTVYVVARPSSITASGTVSVIDVTASPSVVRTLSTNPNPSSLALTPDGSRLFVPTGTGANWALDVIDTRTFTTTPTPAPGVSQPSEAAITPDGRRLLITNYGSDDAPGRTVAILDPAGGPPSTAAEVEARPRDVAITPDGYHAYVLTEGPALWQLGFP